MAGDKVLTHCCKHAFGGWVLLAMGVCLHVGCAGTAQHGRGRAKLSRAETSPASQNASVAEEDSDADDDGVAAGGPAGRHNHRGAKTGLAPRKPTKMAHVSPQEIEQAKLLLDKGLLAFQRGDYDAAEAALSQSMALYPFLAEAHLTLGKIYLTRGSANRDPTMIDHARLMFQMAHAVDPNLRETDLLLQLFLAEPLP